MTKRECIEYIKAEQEKAHVKVLAIMHGEIKDDYCKPIHDCFSRCKKVCADNGYVGECFNHLWSRASR